MKKRIKSPMLPTNYRVKRYNFSQITGTFAIDFGYTSSSLKNGYFTVKSSQNTHLLLKLVENQLNKSVSSFEEKKKRVRK